MGVAGARQHIHGSVFALEAFVEDGRVARVTRDGQIQTPGLRDAAIVKNLITDRQATAEDRFWFEEGLGRLEARWAPAVKRAISVTEGGAKLRPPDDVDDALSTYLALQYARSEHQGEFIRRVRSSDGSPADNEIEQRARLLPEQWEQLVTLMPVSFLQRSEQPLAHPELPFVPFARPGAIGVMLALTPDLLYVRATVDVAEAAPGAFYWRVLLAFPTKWTAVLCAPRHAEQIAARLRAAFAA